MEFLVTMTTRVPDGAAAPEVAIGTLPLTRHPSDPGKGAR